MFSYFVDFEIYRINPNRKRRWDQLNIVLDQNSKKKVKTSASFSSIESNSVEYIFPLKLYDLQPQEIPKGALFILFEQLKGIHKLYGYWWKTTSVYIAYLECSMFIVCRY
jgi:hypothetical protein